MQFTKAEEYGLFGIVHLAKHQRGAVISLAEISKAQQIPDKFLSKIFQMLTRAGIVKSHRGVRGGFSLAKPPNKIRISDVFNAIQGDADPVKCIAEGRPCLKKGECAVRDLILEGRKHMFAYYERQTVEDLAARVR
jgi:Rrf2 family protein